MRARRRRRRRRICSIGIRRWRRGRLIILFRLCIRRRVRMYGDRICSERDNMLLSRIRELIEAGPFFDSYKSGGVWLFRICKYPFVRP